jgi:glycosyltransferase involved in cell wall biosynthesis
MPSAFLPGRWDLIEGFGISYAEASASGKPVIAGRCGGTEDAVQDGVTGVLVDPHDVAALARTIRVLLSNRPLADRLGRAGREWVSKERSLSRLGERVLTLAEASRAGPGEAHRVAQACEPPTLAARGYASPTDESR